VFQVNICFKPLLSRDEFIPMMKHFAELFLIFCFLYFLSGKLLLQLSAKDRQ